MMKANVFRWSPAARVLPRAGLAQGVPEAAPSGMDRFLSSPGVALATDLVAVGISGALAYGYGKAGSNASTVWVVLGTMALVKAWHDVSRL